MPTVIQLVNGDATKGTSGFQEPRTHVLPLTSHGQVTGVFSVSSPLPLPRPTALSELSAISRARTAAEWRQHATRRSKHTEIRV